MSRVRVAVYAADGDYKDKREVIKCIKIVARRYELDLADTAVASDDIDKDYLISSTTNLVITLISSDFLAHDDLYELLLHAANKHKCNELSLLPVIVRACEWRVAELATIEVLPANEIPVNNWDNKDLAYKDIRTGIVAAIRLIQLGRLVADMEREIKSLRSENEFLKNFKNA